MTGAAAAPRLSAIVPTWTGGEVLGRSLPAVAAVAAAFPGGAEVLVVDDNSDAPDDRTPEVVDFCGHCRRHLQVGAMAVTFSARHRDPRVRALLRVDGMRPAEQSSAFLRLVAITHTVVRGVPAPLRGILPRLGLGLASALGLTGPRRLRHVAYHVVRDRFYARGVADARDRDLRDACLRP